MTEGFDVVKKVEEQGSSSGKPKKQIVVVDSGELDGPKGQKKEL